MTYINYRLLSTDLYLLCLVWTPVYPSLLTEIIATLTSNDYLIVVGFYALSSCVIIHTYFSYIIHETSTAQFYIQPTSHYLGARQLNQDSIFLTLYAITLGITYGFSSILTKKNIIKISNVQQPFQYALKTSLVSTFHKSFVYALKVFAMTYITFIFCNGTIYQQMTQWFGSYQRLLNTPVVQFNWLNIPLFIRILKSGILTVLSWNIANSLYDIVYFKTFNVTDQFTNQFDCLINGLSDKSNDLIRIAAFSELAAISCKRPEKRLELFHSIGKEIKDTAWHRIMTQCLDVIKEQRTKIDIEYNGPLPAAVPTQTLKPVENKVRNRIQFSNENVFAVPKENVVTLDDRTCSAFCSPTILAEALPSAPPVHLTQDIKSRLERWVINLLKTLERNSTRFGSLQKVYAETCALRMQSVFQRYQLVIWAIQALGSLTAASLKEDSNGYVQNDIGLVLNTLLGFLQEVERYIQSPPMSYNKLSGALREAIYQITDTFKDYLDPSQIDRKYKKKWDRFICYQE
ncbi:nucleoporin protein Ndc1-Nup [Pilobolus umbonatus]|nr:nucleoporin protein Ndc1-Nup [Pilobolus umbonatus]